MRSEPRVAAGDAAPPIERVIACRLVIERWDSQKKYLQVPALVESRRMRVLVRELTLTMLGATCRAAVRAAAQAELTAAELHELALSVSDALRPGDSVAFAGLGAPTTAGGGR